VASADATAEGDGGKEEGGKPSRKKKMALDKVCIINPHPFSFSRSLSRLELSNPHPSTLNPQP
jgi:hypothetical protein